MPASVLGRLDRPHVDNIGRKLRFKSAHESFFSRYKAELLEGGAFEDARQTRTENFRYIVGYYNRERRHPVLGYKTPKELEQEWEVKSKGESSKSVTSEKLAISLET